jgi:DNA-binding beta-propeller fold protein YncE
MSHRFGLIASLALALALALSGCSGDNATTTTLPLRHVADIPVPGGASRFDYADIDAARHLLVVAHLGDDEVVAVSLESRRVEWTAPHLASIHGIRVDPASGRVFVTATGTNEVVALAEANGRELGRAPTGDFPDGLAVDDTTNRVFVSNKNGGTVTVVRADTLEPVKTITAGDDVGNVQAIPGGGQVLVAAGKDNELLTIDSQRLAVTARDRLPSCLGAHGVAVDPSAARAYVACEDNATLVVDDLTAHREVAHLRVGDTPDVLAIDPAGKRLYVGAESGIVTVVSLDATPTVLGRAHFADNAHTVAVDPALHLVAFALAKVDGRPVIRLEAPT